MLAAGYERQGPDLGAGAEGCGDRVGVEQTTTLRVLDAPVNMTDFNSAPSLVGVSLLRLLRSVNNGGVGRLWPTAGVENQRVLPLSPGATVVQPPEGDALDDILVLFEDGEEFCVISCLLVQVFGRGGSRGSGTTSSESSAELPAGCSTNRDVQLCDADLQPERRVVGDRPVDVFEWDLPEHNPLTNSLFALQRERAQIPVFHAVWRDRRSL